MVEPLSLSASIRCSPSPSTFSAGLEGIMHSPVSLTVAFKLGQCAGVPDAPCGVPDAPPAVFDVLFVGIEIPPRASSRRAWLRAEPFAPSQRVSPVGRGKRFSAQPSTSRSKPEEGISMPTKSTLNTAGGASGTPHGASGTPHGMKAVRVT